MKNCVLFSLTQKDITFINKGFFIALESLKRTNPSLPIFVFYDELPDSILEKIKDNGVTTILLNAATYPACAKELNAINTSARPDLTKATWFKLFIGKLLEFGDFKKVFFLDSDLVVLDDISELFEIDAPFAAVYSKRELRNDYKNTKKIQKQEKLNSGSTFNAGVFVADIQYWVKNDLTKKAFEIVDQYGVEEFVCADQGVLNILIKRYCKKAARIASIYNFCRYHDMRLAPQLVVKSNNNGLLAPIFDEKFVKVLHWNGRVKAWDNKIDELKDKNGSKLYLECYEQFVQKDLPKIISDKKIRAGVVTFAPLAPSETFIKHHIELLNAEHFVLDPSEGTKETYNWIVKVKRFEAFVKKNKINVVLAEFGPAAIQIKGACYKLNLPLIVHFHGYDISRYDTLAKYSSLYSELFKQVFAIIVVSKEMEEKVLRLGASAEKIIYNPCGVDVEKFYPLSTDNIYSKCKGPKIEKPVFMFIGRFIEKKSPVNTIKAFAKALSEMPGAKLIMYGEGPLLPDAKILAKDLGVETAVEFRNSCKHEDVPKLLCSAHIYVQHSITATNGDSEGTPVTILEAGACGLPVISTRHAGIPDVVIDQETGILVNEGDIDGMAQAMVSLTKDSERCISMGKKAREYISLNYSESISDARLKEVSQKAFEWGLEQKPKPKPSTMQSISRNKSQYANTFIGGVIRFRSTKELFIILNIVFVAALIFAWRTFGPIALLISTLAYIVFAQIELFIVFRVLKQDLEEKIEYLKLDSKKDFENITWMLNNLKEVNQEMVKKLEGQLDLSAKAAERQMNSIKDDLSREIDKVGSKATNLESQLNLIKKDLATCIATIEFVGKSAGTKTTKLESQFNLISNDIDKIIELVELKTVKVNDLVVDLDLKMKTLDKNFNLIKDNLNRSIESAADNAERKAVHQAQDYTALTSLLKPVLDHKKGLPYMMHYAATPDFSKKISELILDRKPRVIVELGSGVSTLVSAYCLKLNDSGKIYSFDHLKEFTDRTQATITEHKLEAFVSVQTAPLEPLKIDDREYSWYSLDYFKNVGPIDMLIVDGPPGAATPLSRLPALPVLLKKLNPGAIIVLDDARREDEKQIIELWKKDFPELKYEFIETERGMAIFTVKGNE